MTVEFHWHNPPPVVANSVGHAAKLINAVEFKAGLQLLNAKLYAEPDYTFGQSLLKIRLTISVPHRDHGKLIPVTIERVYVEAQVQMRDVYELAMDLIKDLVIHEVFESFFVDGSLWRDPHRA